MMITVIARMAVVGTNMAEEGVVEEHSNDVVTTLEEIGVEGMVEDSVEHFLRIKWKV
jgi:hypothetical protein